MRKKLLCGITVIVLLCLVGLGVLWWRYENCSRDYTAFFDLEWKTLSYRFPPDKAGFVWPENISFLKRNRAQFTDEKYEDQQCWPEYKIYVQTSETLYVLAIEAHAWRLLDGNGKPLSSWLKFSDVHMSKELFINTVTLGNMEIAEMLIKSSGRVIDAVALSIPGFWDDVATNSIKQKLARFFLTSYGCQFKGMNHDQYREFVCNYLAARKDCLEPEDFFHIVTAQLDFDRSCFEHKTGEFQEK